MGSIGTRLDRLGGRARCPVCKQPDPPRSDVVVRTHVRGVTEEEVRAIRRGDVPSEPVREPERCLECGRATEIIIRMPGLGEKSRG